jgi:hypothetical protein
MPVEADAGAEGDDGNIKFNDKLNLYFGHN